MSDRRSLGAANLAAQAVELGFAVPQVIAHRLILIAAAGVRPSASDCSELWLMSAEKIVAFGESFNAMLFETWRANWAFALSLGTSGWLPVAASSSRMRRHFERTALAALAKGVAPIHRRVVANARRLGADSRKRK